MHTPLAAQGIYTLLLAVSAALVLYAALVSLRHLYPSLKMFYGSGADKLPDSVPYGMVLALVALGFSFAAYVTPATIISALVLLLFSGFVQVRMMPQYAFSLATLGLAAFALFADIDVLKRNGFSSAEIALASGFLAAPVFASFAPRSGGENKSALMLYMLVAFGATIAGPVLTGSFAHGTAAASIIFLTTTVALAYMQGRDSTIGTGVVITFTMLLAHSALVLGHAGAMIPAQIMMAGVIAASVIAAASKVMR